MGGRRKHRKNNRRKTNKPNSRNVRKNGNSNTNNPNERKLEITDDSGTPSQEDREDQSYDLEETEGKNRNDHDMEPDKEKEESLQSMDTLGKNNGNEKDKHDGGKRPSETTRPPNTDTQETDLSEMKPPGGNEASSVTPLHICEVDRDSTSTGADNNKDETVSHQSSDNGADRGTDETPSSNASLNPRNSKTSHEQKIDELEENITHLKENLNAQQKEIKHQDEIMNKKSEENAELLQRCLALEKSAEAAENLKREQNKTHYDEIQALKDELYSAKEDNENLKQQQVQETENTTVKLQRLMDENKYLTESLEQERQTSAALKEEVQSFQREIIKHKSVEEDLNNQVEKLNAQLQTIDSENRALKERLSSSEEIIRKSEEKLRETEERKRSELEDNVNHYRAEMTKQEELVRDLQNKVEELLVNVRTMEHENQFLKDKVEELLDNVRTMEHENQSLREKLATAEEEVKRFNILLQETDQSRKVSEEDTSTEYNDLVKEDVVREKTAIASDAESEDDSVQNEKIEHDNMDREDMQRSTSPTTIDSLDTSIAAESPQLSGAFGYDIGDAGLRNGKMSLNQNEAKNNNLVNADNFKDETDSTQSPDFGTDMAQHQGFDETQNYNSFSDLQNKTSHEEEIENLQQELNILKENLITKQEEIKRQDESINEKNAENADLLHRCVTLETSAEAADNLREQCEDLNQQIEALEGDLASARDENENLKRHLKEIENVTADHQRLIDDNKTLKEYSEQERRSSAALKEEVQTLKEQITNHEDVVNDLKRQHEETYGEKEKLEAKLVSRNGEYSDILGQFLKNEKMGDELRAELEKMQQNDQDKARRIEELSGQLNLKNEELAATEIKHKHEMEEIKAKYKTGMDQAERNKELQKNKMTKLSESCQQLQAENKRIKDDLQTKSVECENLNSERLRITKDLDAVRKEILELNYDKDKLRSDITTANAEIMQLKAALELKEAEKMFANECMQKAAREQQEMMYCIGNLQRIELENEQVKTQNRYLLEQNTKLQASLQEYALLRDHIQEYYKALQDSQMELQREKEKSRHINELLSRTGYRLDSMVSELNNYRTMAERYRSSLEEEKEKFNKLERELDRLTIVNEKLKEERDKCEQKSFEYRDECRSLRGDLEKSQAKCRELLSHTQKGASDGTTGLLQGFKNPNSQTFVFGMGKDSNRKK